LSSLPYTLFDKVNSVFGCGVYVAWLFGGERLFSCAISLFVSPDSYMSREPEKINIFVFARQFGYDSSFGIVVDLGCPTAVKQLMMLYDAISMFSGYCSPACRSAVDYGLLFCVEN
jgi:hypothetical protein